MDDNVHFPQHALERVRQRQKRRRCRLQTLLPPPRGAAETSIALLQSQGKGCNNSKNLLPADEKNDKRSTGMKPHSNAASNSGAVSEVKSDLSLESVRHHPNLYLLYQITGVLGKGAYGLVYDAVDRRSGKRVAIKRVRQVFCDGPVHAKRTLRELRILREMSDHPGIVDVLDVLPPLTADFDEVWIVMERMDCNLHRVLNRPQPTWCTDHVRFVTLSLLDALAHLHSFGIVHRDVKPGNVLVTSYSDSFAVKLCDFGLARGHGGGVVSADRSDASRDSLESIPRPHSMLKRRKVREDAHVHGTPSSEPPSTTDSDDSLHSGPWTGHVATRYYRAIELVVGLRNTVYDSKVDVWACGLILAELLALEPGNEQSPKVLFPAKTCFPYTCDSAKDLTSETDLLLTIFSVLGTPSPEDIMVFSEEWQPFLQSLHAVPRVRWSTLYPASSPLALDLLDRMLCLNPFQRISAAEAMDHPFLRSLRSIMSPQGSDVLQAGRSDSRLAFEFEDCSLSQQQLRRLILQEVDHFSQRAFSREVQCRAQAATVPTQSTLSESHRKWTQSENGASCCAPLQHAIADLKRVAQATALQQAELYQQLARSQMGQATFTGAQDAKQTQVSMNDMELLGQAPDTLR